MQWQKARRCNDTASDVINVGRGPVVCAVIKVGCKLP